MTFDEYNDIMRRIHEQLNTVAKRTENQAWLGIANPDNPEFVSLMQLHKDLVARAIELTDRMSKQMDA